MNFHALVPLWHETRDLIRAVCGFCRLEPLPPSHPFRADELTGFRVGVLCRDIGAGEIQLLSLILFPCLTHASLMAVFLASRDGKGAFGIGTSQERGTPQDMAMEEEEGTTGKDSYVHATRSCGVEMPQRFRGFVRFIAARMLRSDKRSPLSFLRRPATPWREAGQTSREGGASKEERRQARDRRKLSELLLQRIEEEKLARLGSRHCFMAQRSQTSCRCIASIGIQRATLHRRQNSLDS